MLKRPENADNIYKDKETPAPTHKGDISASFQKRTLSEILHSSRIVLEDSARLLDYPTLSIHADHKGMCKFRSFTSGSVLIECFTSSKHEQVAHIQSLAAPRLCDARRTDLHSPIFGQWS